MFLMSPRIHEDETICYSIISIGYGVSLGKGTYESGNLLLIRHKALTPTRADADWWILYEKTSSDQHVATVHPSGRLESFLFRLCCPSERCVLVAWEVVQPIDSSVRKCSPKVSGWPGRPSIGNSVPKRQGARRGPVGGLPRAPDGTGRLSMVRPGGPKGGRRALQGETC